MIRFLGSLWGVLATLSLGFVTLMVSSHSASAHIKWFAPFDVSEQPRVLEDVVNINFLLVLAAALVAFQVFRFYEGTAFGQKTVLLLRKGAQWVNLNNDIPMRASWGFFLIALWNIGGTLLTPELKTTSSFVPWLQLAMAACLLTERTMILTSAGLFFLFGMALKDYGLFHLADYPIFLGIAIYLGLRSLKLQPFGIRPFDILRWLTGITLMWASVEKWAYPHWTYGLLDTRPELAMGFGHDLFMIAAGVIEFMLAFGILWTPLVRRASALALTILFLLAVPMFGKVDAIGHAPIIGILVAILLDRRQTQEKVQQKMKYGSLVCAASVLAFVVVYYGTHDLLFKTKFFATNLGEDIYLYVSNLVDILQSLV